MTSYDYIIVGGGSAGCVAASRLVVEFGASVLLIEAGCRDRHPFIKMPAAFVKLLDANKNITVHKSVPQNQLDNREHFIPQAKVLGGGSSVNGMVYMRGRPEDYDEWGATTGSNAWNYDVMLTYFRKQEDNNRFFNHAHGSGGDLKVSDVRHTSEISRIFIKTLQGMGIAYNPDFNSGDQRGVGFMQTTIDSQGRRSSAVTAFLSKVLKNPKLTIATKSLVTALEFVGNKVTGVRYSKAGNEKIAYAQEVILAAGAYQSPKLLMLSGIGPASALKSHGINVKVDLQGVGQNLQDHHEVPVIAEVEDGYGYHNQDRSWRQIVNGLEYLVFGSGPVNSIGCDSCAYINPDQEIGKETTLPSLQFYCIPAVYTDRDVSRPWNVPGVTLHSCLARPLARGSVTLRSANPADLPLVNPNYLGHPEDMRISIAGLRFARRVFEEQPMSDIYKRELLPGKDITSDAELAAHCRRTVKTNYHPVGTCRMGRVDDDKAVLTPDLKVKGVEGLRIIDASVFPNLVCGNTNAPVMATADRAVDLIMGT